MPSLNPIDCPLSGRLLIEASAGTGKTYTIALLFLRLLLERQLEVNQILVVTFTEAATQELRDRIRQRLREALDLLKSLLKHPDQAADPVLQALLEPHLDKAQSQSRLADALVRMDEAAIYTIHGFCARVLQDHAFDTGMAFELKMIGSDDELALKLMCDFWRIQLATLDSSQLQWLIGKWPRPERLLQALGTLLKQQQLQIRPHIDPQMLKDLWQEFDKAHARLVESWRQAADKVRETLNSPERNKNSYNPKAVQTALGAMDSLSQHSRLLDTEQRAKFELFTPEKLQKGTRKGHAVPQHEFFDLAAAFLDIYERLDRLSEPAWLHSAHEWLKEQLAGHKASHQQLAFNDLINHLAEALNSGTDQSSRLRAQLQNSYPVALIDEFQDTDASQYLIFKRIYSGPDTGLLMIGDPKQAIYNFRGGDIFAYLQARADTAEGQRFNLDTNWRSSSGLVRAVNSLFGRSGIQQPFALTQGLEFIPVRHSPKADKAPLLINGQPPPPLDIWLLQGRKADDKGRSKEILRAEAATAAAQHLAQLLNLAAQGQALIGDAPLKAQDIAILVRTHDEGQLMQQALAERGIIAVSKNKQKIFHTPEAEQLSLLLKALANPGNEAQIRLLLISPLMGLGLEAVQALIADEAAWDSVQQVLLECRERWQKHSFMAAFLDLLHQLEIPSRILARPQGERQLTNLMQLGELLQSASREYSGIEALLNWYASQLNAPDESDDYELRLESDESLVHIVTIHSSKGLEYPIVLLPFVWNWDEPAKECLYHEDGHYYMAMADSATEANQAQARAERLSAHLRLLYVALTRARNQCLVFWGNMPNIKSEASEPQALAWLLHQTANPPGVHIPESLEAVKAALKPLTEASAGSIGLSDWPVLDDSHYQPQPLDKASLKAARPGKAILDDWRISSYSGLIQGLEQSWRSEEPDHDLGELSDSLVITQPESGAYTRFSFPRGPQIGSFLHSLLELCDFQAPDAGLIEAERNRYGIQAQWQPVLEQWLAEILNTELDDQGLKLAAIGQADRLNEMAFDYPLNGLSTRALQRLLLHYPAYAREAAGLGFKQLHGLMRGFIDLVIRDAQGRFYILDYKSNHLGDQLQDYGPKALELAMDRHQYRLQYLIYCLALHRYLGQRLRDYSYEHHFGGVYYLFLRGMQPGSRNGIYHDRPSLEFLESMDALMAGKKAA
jgi:exodeoxyribonuclease V beta subunit